MCAGHCEHSLLPVGAYVPSGQLMHWYAASYEIVPGPHCAHVVAPVWPAGYEYRPARHQSQMAVRPTVGLAIPRMQGMQSESVSVEQVAHPTKFLYLPATHSVQTLAPPQEYAPISHRLQFPAPVWFVQVPGAHSVQVLA